MNRLPKWAKTAGAWLGLGAALFAFYAGAAAIGLDVPRPTWFAEHTRDIEGVKATHKDDVQTLAAGGRDTRQRTLGLQLELRRARYFQNRAEQTAQMAKTGRVDPNLLKEEAFLTGVIRSLEAELKALETGW